MCRAKYTRKFLLSILHAFASGKECLPFTLLILKDLCTQVSVWHYLISTFDLTKQFEFALILYVENAMI